MDTDQITPDTRASGASWPAVFVVAVGAFALITTEFLPVALLPRIAGDIGVSEGVAGLMVTIPGFVAAASALVTTAVAGRVDRRHILWVLLGLLVVSNLIVAVATSFAVLLVGRVLLGIGLGGFWTIAASLGPRLRIGAEGARANSVIFSGVSLGTLAGVPAGSLLGDLLGWRLAFGAAGAIAVGVVLAVFVVVPSLPPEPTSGIKAISQIIKRRQTQIAIGGLVLLFAGQFAAYTYITPYLNTTSGIKSAALSAVLLAYGAAGFAGNFFGGWFAARHVRSSVSATAALIGGGIALMVTTGTSPAPATVAIVIWGFGFGMLPISLQNLMFQSAPDHPGAAAALYVSVGQVAIGGGALLGGVIVSSSGPSSALWTGVGATVIALLLILSSDRRRARAPVTTAHSQLLETTSR